MTDRTVLDVPELRTALLSERPPVVLDVRWHLGGPNGKAEYLAGHVPGAVYVDLDTELAGPVRPESGGRHPLPDPAVLTEALRRAGVGDASWVVCYDAGDGLAAARAWWLARWAGLTEVTVLDGGWPAWQAAGAPTETAVPTPEPGDFTARPGAMPVVDAAGAAELARSGVLLDARTPERFRGETEPIDRVPGRVPGAVNAPAGGDARAGRLLKPAELATRYAELGVSEDVPVGAYCGSGVTAARTVLALHTAGIPAALYVGSYSDWISDPDRPIETG